MEFVVKANDNKIYEISELVTEISYTDKLNDGCSKLEFTYINDDLIIENGSVLYYRYNSTNIFYGYVFKVSRDKDGEISVTAYDQLRYAKAKDYLSTEGHTATSLVNKMCRNFNFNKGMLADTKYLLSTTVYDGNTWLDIIYTSISETLTNKGKKYCLRDEFGKITLRDIEDLTLNLILGDKALCYDYSYKKTIDDDFYNQILILAKGDNNQFVGAKDESSIKKYGMLQYYESMDDTNASQAKAKARALLSLYNHEDETLKLKCLGDTRIRAGSSFYLMMEDVLGTNITKKLIVNSVTHDYVPVHTMDLEVCL